MNIHITGGIELNKLDICIAPNMPVVNEKKITAIAMNQNNPSKGPFSAMLSHQ